MTAFARLQVRITLDAGKEASQFEALSHSFFSAFSPIGSGFERPDPGDMGSPYRAMVGIPGGVDGELYTVLEAANRRLQTKYNKSMILKADGVGNTTQDEFNTV